MSIITGAVQHAPRERGRSCAQAFHFHLVPFRHVAQCPAPSRRQISRELCSCKGSDEAIALRPPKAVSLLLCLQPAHACIHLRELSSARQRLLATPHGFCHDAGWEKFYPKGKGRRQTDGTKGSGDGKGSGANSRQDGSLGEALQGGSVGQSLLLLATGLFALALYSMGRGENQVCTQDAEQPDRPLPPHLPDRLCKGIGPVACGTGASFILP